MVMIKINETIICCLQLALPCLAAPRRRPSPPPPPAHAAYDRGIFMKRGRSSDACKDAVQQYSVRCAVQQYYARTNELSHTRYGRRFRLFLFLQHLHKRRLEESHELRRKKRQSEGKAVAPPRKLQVSK